MDFALSDEQEAVATAARTYLERTYPLNRVAELADAGLLDLDAWPELNRQGWLDPDLGMLELALLAVESGRVLHPVPWLSSAVLAGPVYGAAGVRPPGPVTLAVPAAGCRARARGPAWSLEGTAKAVDGPTAAEIVIAADTPGGMILLGVRPGDAGVSVVQAAGIDPLRPLGVVTMAGARARLLLGPDAAGAQLELVRRRSAILLAGEAVGVADRALRIAVEHAVTRTQFDRPIGSFQAVSHPLAEAYADVELARSLCYRAAAALQAGAEELAEAIACAAHAAGSAAVTVCETAIQVCGGMGVTWEFPLHRWFRRALWLEAVLTADHTPLRTLAEVLLEQRTEEDDPLATPARA